MISNPAAWPSRDRAALALMLATLVGSLVVYVHGPWGHGDIDGYRRYAVAFWAGADPLRSLPVEYPLFALAPFTLTVLPPLPDAVAVYGLWMLLLFVVGYLAIRGREGARTAEVCGVYLVLGCFGTVLGRFDLFPAAAVVVAYWAARQQRFPLAYAMLAVGAMLKLYPVFLLPVLVLEHCRALGVDPLRSRPPRAVLQGLALFVAPVAAMFAVSAVLTPDTWLGPFTFNAHRPLQVESLPASLLWLTSFLGLPVAADRSFNSYNLVGQVDGVVSYMAQVAMVGGCLWAYWRQLTGRLSFGRAVTLCLLVIVCTNRVFSPQYLMWVVPMIAIVERDYDPAWLVVCALTTLIFPFLYDWTDLHGHPVPHDYPLYFPAVIAVRNAVLLVATVRFARRPAPAVVGAREAPAKSRSSVA